MYSQLIALTALAGFLATAAASPAPAPAADTSPATGLLETRKEQNDVVIVNVYTGNTCSGESDTWTVTEGKACYVVDGINSIEVSEHDCETHAFSGNDCRGNKRHIEGGRCVTFINIGSVSVSC